MVFTGNKARNVKDAMPGMVRLSPKELKEIPTVLGVKDPIKYLKLTPGIQSAEGGNRGIFVRGGGADQNLIMLDQTPLYNPSHLGGMFSIFMPETIKNLEVHKGNIPAYYGGRLSSVISLNTNKGNTKRMNYKGNLGMLSSSFYIDLNTSMKWGNSAATLRWSHIWSKYFFMNTSVHYTGYRFNFSANQSMYHFNMLTNINDYKLDVKPRMVSLFPFLPSVSWSFKF